MNTEGKTPKETYTDMFNSARALYIISELRVVLASEIEMLTEIIDKMVSANDTRISVYRQLCEDRDLLDKYHSALATASGTIEDAKIKVSCVVALYPKLSDMLSHLLI